MTSQGDSRGRSRTKMVSQSQRKYHPPPPSWRTQPKWTCFETMSHSVIIPYMASETGELSGTCCSFLCFLLPGVQLFVATTGTISSMWICLCLQVPMNPIAHQVLLFVCQSECAYLCATVGISDPPATAVIPITVFCVKGKRECVSYSMLCLITGYGLVGSL